MKPLSRNTAALGRTNVIYQPHRSQSITAPFWQTGPLAIRIPLPAFRITPHALPITAIQ